VLGKFGKAKQE
jgi:hypothetical protein